jgi:hypothetical protein
MERKMEMTAIMIDIRAGCPRSLSNMNIVRRAPGG